MTCEWPVDRSCLPALPDPLDPTYQEKLDRQTDAESKAVQVLWALSGRQFGCQEVVYRPPTAPFVCAPSSYRPAAVPLPGPVMGIVTVTIGDEVLAPGGYALEGDLLYRVGARWPGQDFNQPMGSPGTWSVTYQRGQSIPNGVGALVGALAKEFIAACGSGKCRLPHTVVATTRNGVSHSFDPSRMLAAGWTGIPEIDQWLAAVNPNHILQGPSVV